MHECVLVAPNCVCVGVKIKTDSQYFLYKFPGSEQWWRKICEQEKKRGNMPINAYIHVQAYNVRICIVHNMYKWMYFIFDESNCMSYICIYISMYVYWKRIPLCICVHYDKKIFMRNLLLGLLINTKIRAQQCMYICTH